MITIKTDHKIVHKIETQVTTIDTEIIPSHHRNNNRYPDSKHRHRSNTPKHQRHINQVQTNEETTSDPPGIDDTGSNELQLNHINCESTDTESDTDNTISVNMITVKNDYEPIIYEQPFTSHVYKNQLELLNNYYIGPINNNTQTTQEVNEINTVIKPDKKDEHKTYLSKYTKRTTKRKNLDNSISLRESMKQRISTTRS